MNFRSAASRSKASVILGVAALCAASPLRSAPSTTLPEEIAQLQRVALADERAFAALQSLTTEVGPRLAGSAGDAQAVAWAVRTLREQGFSNVRAEPVTVPRWVRGEGRVQLLGGPAPVELKSLALGGSVGTDGTPVEADVLAVTDLDDLARHPRADVVGKIVFFYDRMLETRDGMDYGPTVRHRSQGAIAAAKLGAVGVVIRAVGTADADRPHTGAMRYANGVPRIPAFAIGHHSADRVLADYARGPVRLRLESSSRCEAPAASANVIGEIPGRAAASGAPEQYVVLGAHLDSWDVGTGAQDDGAGIVTVMEAARRVGEMRERPLRTLRVVLFANEEFGLSGGRQYALDHAAHAARHHAAIEADLGAGRVFRFESRVKPADVKSAMQIAQWLQPLGIRYEGNVTGGGADIGPLRELGVPMFELQHDASKYFEIHHTDADRIDRVNPQDLAFNVAAYATVARALADGPELARAERSWPVPPENVHPCDWKPVP